MVWSSTWLETFLNQMLTLPHCQLWVTKCLSFSAQFNVYCAPCRGRMKGGVNGVCSNPDYLFTACDRIKEPLSHLEEPSSRPECKLSQCGRMKHVNESAVVSHCCWDSLVMERLGIRASWFYMKHQKSINEVRHWFWTKRLGSQSLL